MYLIFKRIFDIVFSLILIILLIPVFLLVAIGLKITHIKHVIFVQQRSGKNNKVFNIYKFTTFDENNKIPKFCFFLRKTGIDELPQLFNILKGEMSFIGPRPWITEYSKYFTKKQLKRLDVKPGLTGYSQAQVCKNIFEKIEYDLYYVENISLFLDIKIIFKTIGYVFSFRKKEFTETHISREIKDLKKGIK